MEGERGRLKLLINAEEPEECRVALVENGRLEAFHVATVADERTKNNIYKGRIVSVEANLQAAFVDIGTERNGFLPFGEIHPEYYREDLDDRCRQLVQRDQLRDLKIEEVVQRGQEVLVQVAKEVTGSKGANLTTYLSIPGRYIVLMPGSDSAGISRKIVDDERRQQLREMMHELELPEGIGYIIRTASQEITGQSLQQDLRELLALWGEIRKRGQAMASPALIHEEHDVIARFLRDHFTADIQEILVDTQEAFEQVSRFVATLPAGQRDVKVRLHRGPRPVFNHHNIEEQIEAIYRPRVALPSGGSIVIDSTEALVAIDVNSGRTSKDSDFEESIFLANMEAAAELARQLRLRDLGGLIVVDFIDMRHKRHIQAVERQVKTCMKRDKAKVDFSTISRFGLMQISRQKMGAPIERGNYLTCEHCQGRGVVRSVETQALAALRRILTGITRKKVVRAECTLPSDVAMYLLNRKRAELQDFEARHGVRIILQAGASMRPGEQKIELLDHN
ncbi:MAG: hypothetical protein BWK76_20305 [Desulfobulbaceae bacterium A2]|nr:MAG: hypothetical protein BWK76_20305 [Desulfobulbaceae bacterium A2]